MNVVKIKTEKPFGSSRNSNSNNTTTAASSGGATASRVSPSSPIEVIDLSLSDSDDDDNGNVNANTTNTTNTTNDHRHAPSPTSTVVSQKSRDSPQQQQQQHGSYAKFGRYATSFRKRTAAAITQDDDIDIDGDGDDAPKIVTPWRKKKKKSTPSNNTTNARAGARSDTTNFGAVGYKFQKEFVVEPNQNIEIFYGEVIEILDRDVPNKKGKYRRCLYNDGDTEDLSLIELRKYKAVCTTAENNDCSSNTTMVVDAPSSEAGSINEEDDSCNSSTGRKGSTNEEEDNSCDSSTSRKDTGGKKVSLGLSYQPMEEECNNEDEVVDKAASNDCGVDDVNNENEDDNNDDVNEPFSVANVLDKMQVEARECGRKRRTTRRKLRKYKTTLVRGSESDTSASELEEESDDDEIEENRDETTMATGEETNDVQDEDDAGAMTSFGVSESDASAGKRAECDDEIDENLDEGVTAREEANGMQDEDGTSLVETSSSSPGAKISSGSAVQEEERDEGMMRSEQPTREATDSGSYPPSGVQGARRCSSEDDEAGVVETVPEGSDSIGSGGAQEESENDGTEMSRLDQFAGADMAGGSGADSRRCLTSNGHRSDDDDERNSTSTGQDDEDNNTGYSEVLSKVDSNTDEEFGFGMILPEIDLNPSVNDGGEKSKDDVMKLGNDRVGLARTISEGNSGLDSSSNSGLDSRGEDESGILNGATSPEENSRDEEGTKINITADSSSDEEDLFASCDEEEEDVGDGREQHPMEHVEEPRDDHLNSSEAKIYCQKNGSAENKDTTNNNMDSTNSDDDDLFCSSSDDDEDLFPSSEDEAKNLLSSDDDEDLFSSDDNDDEVDDGDHTSERQHFLDVIRPNYNDYEDDDDDGRFSEASADDIMEDDDDDGNNQMAVSYSESNRQGLSLDQSTENHTSPQKKTKFVGKKWGTTLMSNFTMPIVEREVPECYYFATQWGHRMKVRERPVGKGPPPSKLKSFGIKYEILFSELKTTKGKGPAEDGSE